MRGGKPPSDTPGRADAGAGAHQAGAHRPQARDDPAVPRGWLRRGHDGDRRGGERRHPGTDEGTRRLQRDPARLRPPEEEASVQGRPRASEAAPTARAPARGPARRRRRVRDRAGDRRRPLRRRRQGARKRGLEGQRLPGPGPPPSLHARAQVARLGPPAPARLGRLRHDAWPRAQGPAHGVAPGRRPRDRAEPPDPQDGPLARAPLHRGRGPRGAQRHRHGEEGLMAEKDTKKKPAAKKAAPAKAAPAKAEARPAAKPARAATPRAKAPAKAATPARPARRAVARPVTRVVKREEDRRGAPPPGPRERQAPRPKTEPRPLPTAPAGHAPLIALDGSASGSVELPAPIAPPARRRGVVAQAMLAGPANARQPTAATKKRSPVAGGGAEPWRQKGTGRARQGSTPAPHWRHGRGA